MVVGKPQPHIPQLKYIDMGAQGFQLTKKPIRFPVDVSNELNGLHLSPPRAKADAEPFDECVKTFSHHNLFDVKLDHGCSEV